MSDPMHILRPSAPRRLFGLAIQVGMGAIVIYVALAYPPENALWQIALIGLGVVSLVMAQRGWHGSGIGIVLDADGLRQEDGQPIAALDNIAAVDRAIFSFKPSNGFLITLREPMARAWVPGMWWRIGRRVGIGGVTSGAETKIVADALALMVARREDAGEKF